LAHREAIFAESALRPKIRLMLQAMVTKLRSPRTLSSARRRNCRKPRTDHREIAHYLTAHGAQTTIVYHIRWNRT
jgi:hypothetical protein